MSQIYPALSRSKKSKSNYELLEQLKQNSLNWYDVKFQGYTLPSTREAHAWCRTWSWRGCMNIAGHAGTEAEGRAFVKSFLNQCFSAHCGKCASSWISRESNKSASRLEKYEKDTGEKAKHIIISPPSWFGYKSVSELRKEVYQILKNLNAQGGLLIVHPFREEHEQETLSGKTRWYPSIHFHVVGFGWLNYGLVVENYHKSGWIVKDKGIRETNYGTVRYLLTHAGVKKGFHTVTWFGKLSYSNLSMPKYDNVSQLCPYCSEKVGRVLPYDVSSTIPPPQMMECLVDVASWFIPEYPQFLWVGGNRVRQNIFHN